MADPLQVRQAAEHREQEDDSAGWYSPLLQAQRDPCSALPAAQEVQARAVLAQVRQPASQEAQAAPL